MKKEIYKTILKKKENYKALKVLPSKSRIQFKKNQSPDLILNEPSSPSVCPPVRGAHTHVQVFKLIKIK